MDGATIGTALGGIGCFLLGMALLTDGLQAAAGDQLRHVLKRYTRTRLSSVLTGVLATAVVQSSSATTLITIGFVGAGLLSLTAALGVVFGANVGTTVTSWIVAGIGLKVKMNAFALPLVGIGALYRLFTRGRRAAIGTAVAGFGLVFVGIEFLQSGMEGIAQTIDLEGYAGRGPLTLLLFALIGAVMTVVMQSSSAAVATTLAAVAGGTIGLVQAAALVIGQNVGTTVTAGIGSIGGGAAVKRTALAHLIFNLVTATVALALLPVMWSVAGDRFAQRDPALVISAFHTLFNLLGLLLFLPFVDKLARWLERRIPERGAELTRRLASGRGAGPTAMLEACRLTTHDIAAAALELAVDLFSGPVPEETFARRIEAIRNALTALRDKLASLHAAPRAADYEAHVDTLHALDHLLRLSEALEEPGHAEMCRRHETARPPMERLKSSFVELAKWTRAREGDPPDYEGVTREIAAVRRTERPRILERTAAGQVDAAEGERLLEAMRWIDRLGYHTARMHQHLAKADKAR